jgi:hypothetical protein
VDILSITSDQTTTLDLISVKYNIIQFQIRQNEGHKQRPLLTVSLYVKFSRNYTVLFVEYIHRDI